MIKENVREVLSMLPRGVGLVAAAKTRSTEEVLEAIEAGIKMVGHNYVQEAEKDFETIAARARVHMIGHLQSNKARKAVQLFDMIETLDSMKLAKALDKACLSSGRIMPVLVEINSGEEDQKAGVMPADAVSFIREIAGLKGIKIEGLMTMGPYAGDPEQARPYFVRTRAIFEKIRGLSISGVDMRYLSMGMSNSYGIAVEEGANLVRIGTRLFGERR